MAGRYTESSKLVRVYFPNPKAALPVLQADGSVEWLPWGRRQEQKGKLPATGWARVDSIRAGKWARFHPREVWIVAERFMEKDPAGVSHWFDLEEGQAIEGLLVAAGDERRVYVVSTLPPPGCESIHGRWPLVRLAE
ncbi:hypothetical protein PRJ_5664 (plasmid) [Pseudomonas sp. XWY-1]|uniref:hypothetical protein n=1 Tax=unclassified Pseudomonas TaxID=196821 RepID=UPI000AB2346D|nr:MULTISPECIES: hypothetical protein [unclassified Pseudomonas]AUZ62222.1 hypothetical protein PRJ_5664 [Pseudomonas sp. XWY-1]